MANSDDKLFKPIHNPYIVGNPIRGRKMFFGREDDFAYIKTKITGEKEGGLIVLCGARRSGKTSILFQVQEGRLGDEFVPVLIDMQSMAIGNDGDFLNKVAQAIKTSGCEPTESQMDEYLLGKEENPFEAFEQFIKRYSAKLGDKKLVLTFDEYELFETHFDSGVLSEQILRLLSNLIEHRNLFIVFTGSDKLESRSKKYWDILSKGQNKRISFLTRKDTLRLILEPTDGAVRYDDGVPEAIADLTAGQPFYTQVLCQTIVDHLNEEQKNDVSAEDLQRVVNEVIVNPLPQMIFHWNTLPAMEKLCLSAISEIARHDPKPVSADDIASFAGKEKLGYHCEPNALKKSLENLFKGDLLDKSAEEDTYTFKMGLWQSWITRMHSVWQVIDEMERNGEVPGDLKPVTRSNRRRWVYAAAALFMIAAAVITFRGFIFGGSGGVPGAPASVSGDYGWISIGSRPADAEVLINGAIAGRTPVKDSLETGAYEIRISRTGYFPVVDTMIVLKNAITMETYDLVPRVGSVLVRSSPPGASIWLDGENTGLITPNELTGLPVADDHNITLVMEGYDQLTIPVRLIADSTVPVNGDLSSKTAPLTVRSQPAGATYDLAGGRWTGATPDAVTAVEHGRHLLRVSKAGYKDWERTIPIPYPDNEIVVPLEKLSDGYFEFKIDPVADVYLDGTLVKKEISYWVQTARPGRHTLELRRGAGSYRETHNLVPGDTITVEYKWEN